MIAENIPELSKLTPQEKLALANELWGDFAGSSQDTPLDAAVLRLLEARDEQYRLNPDSAISWEDFRRKWGLAADE